VPAGFEIVPADQVPLPEQAATFTEAFRGYAGGDFALDAAGLSRVICAQGADLCYSAFARSAAGFCGFGYITRTGDFARLCGMGVIESARRSGIARALVRHLLEQARARGDRTMLLEVIEQNRAACALYRNEGFCESARLTGWRRSSAPPPGDGITAEPIRLEEVSLARASQLPSAIEFPEWPWQISRHAIAKVAAARAYRSDHALLVISDASAPGPIRLHALSFLGAGVPDWVVLRKTLATLLAAHPSREFFSPALWPESFAAEVFGPLGFSREPISQFLMRQELVRPRAGREPGAAP
jgi:ribosomal protein S18 acetylase RimI-like enzyme